MSILEKKKKKKGSKEATRSASNAELRVVNWTLTFLYVGFLVGQLSPPSCFVSSSTTVLTRAVVISGRQFSLARWSSQLIVCLARISIKKTSTVQTRRSALVLEEFEFHGVCSLISCNTAPLRQTSGQREDRDGGVRHQIPHCNDISEVLWPTRACAAEKKSYR